MRQNAQIMNISNIVSASGRSKEYVRVALEVAEKIINDSDKKERVSRCECKACFYYIKSRVGGSAITIRPCMRCHKDVTYSSTATDVLCIECAKIADLCKRCGADINLRERRKDWPEPLENKAE